MKLYRACVHDLAGDEQLLVEAWVAHLDPGCEELIGSMAVGFKQCLQCRRLPVSSRRIDRARLLAVVPEPERPLLGQEEQNGEVMRDAGMDPEQPEPLPEEHERGPACPALSSEKTPVTPDELLGYDLVGSSEPSASLAVESVASVELPSASSAPSAVRRAGCAGSVALEGSPSASP